MNLKTVFIFFLNFALRSWIVSPENRTAQVFLLKDGMLVPEAFYLAEDIGKVHVLSSTFEI